MNRSSHFEEIFLVTAVRFATNHSVSWSICEQADAGNDQTITYLKLSYVGLAHEMSIPELVLRDAVEGKMGRLADSGSGSVKCWVCQPRISYNLASEMVLLAGKSASRPFPSPRTKR